MVRVTPEPLLEASVDDKNLMCLVTFSQDTNSKQDEISEQPRAPCDGTNKIRCSVIYASKPSQGVLTLRDIFATTPTNVHFSVKHASKPLHKKVTL